MARALVPPRAAWLLLLGLPLLFAASCRDGGSVGGAAGDANGGVSGMSSAGSAGELGGQAGELGNAAGAAGAAGEANAEGGSAGEAPVTVDPGHDTCHFPPGAALTGAALAPGFCAWVWSGGVPSARGMKTDAEGNVLVVSAATGEMRALWDDDGDGVSDPASERLVLTSGLELSHGVELAGGFLYASSKTQVYRWHYVPRALLGTPEVVITGMPATGHRTRTLLADAHFLYVSIGAGDNLDKDSSRARIMRFELTSLSGKARDFFGGEVFADGLRNTVGLGFDARGRLWGVDNGPDGMSRSDLGGDLHEDNPAEELNLFATPGRFYGYPYCWPEFLLSPDKAAGPGSEWSFADGVHSDAWCRDPANVTRPAFALQAHSAPLDISFYQGHSFPSAFVGGAFITFHGSWNRTVPTGYRVVYLGMAASGMPSGAPIPILSAAGPGQSWSNRPVSLTVLPNGVLLVSNDYGVGNVLAIGYQPPKQ
jgi:glucose/arabinose dehydrogenase